MKTSIILMTLFLSSFSLSAAVPTMEGLFRNGANADVTGDTIAISIAIEKISTEEENSTRPVYAKFIFSNNEKEPVRMIQVIYSNATMDNSAAVDVVVSSDIIDQIRKDSPIERKLIYSMLLMYGLNSSEAMNVVSKRVSPDYQSNKDLVNVEKRELYQRYMNYLRNRDETAQPTDEEESPLKPQDEEEQERVKEILASKFLNQTESVVLSRQKGNFFWEVRLENLIARFTHQDHRLRTLTMNTIDGILQVALGDFVMFNGVHELPKVMSWVLPNGESYKFTTLAHQDFVSRNKSFNQRVLEYEEIIQANSGRQETLTSPTRQIFLY
jgi:hypothetical protein